jgi:hypothetical protein
MADYTVNINETVDVSERVLAKSPKQKVTLGISKDVVEKAKAAGINISEITEDLLTTMTFQPKGNTKDDVMNAYQSFLDVMSKLLEKYGASAPIGSVNYSMGPDTEPEDPNELWTEHWTFYVGAGGVWKAGYKEWYNGHNESLESDNKVPLSELMPYMFEPKTILENLIKAITTAAEYNKEKLAQLDFAMRLVQTMKEEENPGKKKN